MMTTEALCVAPMQHPTQVGVVVDTTAERKVRRRGMSRHMMAFSSMILGTALVLGLVITMNAAVAPPAARAVEPVAEFAVQKPPPPKKQRTERPRRNKQVKTAAAPRAPQPNLATALGGIQFDLPSIEAAGLVGASGQLLSDANRKTAMTADAVDEVPKPRRRVPPQYPERARERGIEGYVAMKLNVAADGTVTAVRVVDAKPRGVFEQVAIASVKQSEFHPATYHGAPTEFAGLDLTVRFELN